MKLDVEIQWVDHTEAYAHTVGSADFDTFWVIFDGVGDDTMDGEDGCDFVALRVNGHTLSTCPDVAVLSRLMDSLDTELWRVTCQGAQLARWNTWEAAELRGESVVEFDPL